MNFISNGNELIMCWPYSRRIVQTSRCESHSNKCKLLVSPKASDKIILSENKFELTNYYCKTDIRVTLVARQAFRTATTNVVFMPRSLGDVVAGRSVHVVGLIERECSSQSLSSFFERKTNDDILDLRESSSTLSLSSPYWHLTTNS